MAMYIFLIAALVLIRVSSSNEFMTLFMNTPSKMYTMEGDMSFSFPKIEGEVSTFIMTIVSGDGDFTLSCTGDDTKILLDTKAQQNVPVKYLQVNQDVTECLVKVETVGLLSFTLVGEQSRLGELKVVPNIPQMSFVGKESSKNFLFQSQKDGVVEITTTYLKGDIDIFVGIGKKPSREDHDHSHVHCESKTIKVTLKKSDEVFIVVEGIRESMFQILVKEDDPVLSAGIPVLLNMQEKETTTFRYMHNDDSNDFVITVNELYGYDDPELDIRIGKLNEDFVWEGKITREKNYFVVDHTDIKFGTGWFKIEISTKEVMRSEFRFYLQTEVFQHYILVPGIPFRFVNDKEKIYQNFVSYGLENEKQIFSVHNDEREISCMNVFGSTTDILPTVEKHEFKSTVEGVNSIIKIEESKNLPYFISVECTVATEFRITKTYIEDARFFYLSDNSFISSEVSQGLTDHYFYELDPFGGYDIEITLHTVTGDLALYVASDNEDPQRNNFIWKSNIPMDNVDNIILITPDDPIIDTERFSGKMYVSVRAFKDSSYYITTKYKDVIPEVFHGIGTNEGIDFSNMKYYKYRYNYDGSSQMNIESEGVCYTSMYLSKSYKPIEDTNQFFKNVLETEQHMEFEQSHGWWYIGVSGKSNECQFDIGVEESFGILDDGGSYYSFVLKDMCRYFKIPIREILSGDIHIGTTLISGDVETYIKKGSIPTFDDYDAKDDQYYANILKVTNEIDDFHVMVCGKEVNSTFEIHTTYKNEFTAQLQLDSKMALRAQTGIQYAWMLAPLDQKELRVSILTRNSPIDIYVSENENPDSSSKWKMTVEPFSYNNFVVKGYSKEQLYFGYKSTDKNANFVVVVTDGSNPIHLFTQEYQHFDTVPENQLFQLKAPVYDTTFHVQLDSCTDDSIVNFGLKKFITSNEIYLESKKTHEFSSIIRQDNSFKNQKFYLLPNNDEFSKSDFSFNIDYDSSRRPTPQDSSVHYQIRNDLVKLTFQEVNTPTSEISYSVYRRAVEGGSSKDLIDGLNVKTACSTRKNAKIIGEGKVDQNIHSNGESGSLSYITQLNAPNEVESFTVLPFDPVYGYGSLYNAVFPTVMKLGSAKHALVDPGKEVNLILPEMSNEIVGSKLTVVITHFSGKTEMTVGSDTSNYSYKMDQFGVIEIDIDSPRDLGSYYIKVVGGEETSSFSVHCYTEKQTNRLESEYPQLMKTGLSHTKFNFLFKENGFAFVHIVPLVDTPSVFYKSQNHKFIHDSLFDVYPIEGKTGDVIELSVSPKSAYSIYYIAVSHNSTYLTMIEGVPVGGKMDRKNTQKEYIYQCFGTGEIAFNMFTFYGQVVGYVSTTNMHPDKKNHEFMIRDSLVINVDTPKVFYVNVVSEKENSYFHMTVAPIKNDVLMLNGVPGKILKDGSKTFSTVIESELEMVAYPSLNKYGLSSTKFSCEDLHSETVGSLEIAHVESTDTRVVSCEMGEIENENMVVNHMHNGKVVVPKGSSMFYQRGNKEFVLHVSPDRSESNYAFSLHVERGSVKFSVHSDTTFIYSSLEGELQYEGNNLDGFEKIYVRVVSTWNDEDAKYTFTYHQDGMKVLYNTIPVLNSENVNKYTLHADDVTKGMEIEFIPHDDIQNSHFIVANEESETFANSRYTFTSLSSIHSDIKIIPKMPVSTRIGGISISNGKKLLQMNDHSTLVNVTKGDHENFYLNVDTTKKDVCVSGMIVTGDVTIVLNYKSNVYPTLHKYEKISKNGGLVCVDGAKVTTGIYRIRVYANEDTLMYLKVDSREFLSKMDIGKPERIYLDENDDVVFKVRVPMDLIDGKIYLTDSSKESRVNNSFVVMGSLDRKKLSQKNHDFACNFKRNSAKNLQCAFTMQHDNGSNDKEGDRSLYLMVKNLGKKKNIDFRLEFSDRQSFINKNEEVRTSSKFIQYNVYSHAANSKNKLMVRVDACDPYSSGLGDLELKKHKHDKFEQQEANSDYSIQYKLTKNHNYVHQFNITSCEDVFLDNEILYYLEDEIPMIPTDLESIKIVENMTLSSFWLKGYTLRIDYKLGDKNLKKVLKELKFVIYLFQSKSLDFTKKNFHTRCALNSWISKLDQDYSFKKENRIALYDVREINHENARYNEEKQCIEVDLKVKSNHQTVINVVSTNDYNQMDSTYFPLITRTGSIFFQILAVLGIMAVFGFAFVLFGAGLFCTCKCLSRKKNVVKSGTFLSISNPTVQTHTIPGEDESDDTLESEEDE